MRMINLIIYFFSLLPLMTVIESKAEDSKVYPSEAIAFYLRQVSSTIIGRPLSLEEKNLIEEKRIEAVAEILDQWMTSGFFITSVRSMLETQMSVSGKANGVNFNLPGNLAAYLAQNKLPYSSILTANYCIGDDGKKTPCDTGAPYSAGVLTTKAYMVNGQGRFNLRRARKMLKQFACKQYPLNRTLQIPLLKQDLITMFQDDQAPNTGDQFGNGTACYSCHSQFGAHTQFYVKFDSFGVYQASATGEQDTSPGVEAGRSKNNLYTSHLNTSAKSSEESQMFGHTVSNLAEAAKVMTESPLFLQCGIRNVLQYYLRLLQNEADGINEDLIETIHQKILNESKDPTFQQIIKQALIHPLVIESVLKAGRDK